MLKIEFLSFSGVCDGTDVYSTSVATSYLNFSFLCPAVTKRESFFSESSIRKKDAQRLVGAKSVYTISGRHRKIQQKSSFSFFSNLTVWTCAEYLEPYRVSNSDP